MRYDRGNRHKELEIGKEQAFYEKLLERTFFNLPTRRGLVNITGEVQNAIRESGIQEGLVLVNAMNITASVFINDNEFFDRKKLV